jgi:tetratricopeptide (TPR) repeat protein
LINPDLINFHLNTLAMNPFRILHIGLLSFGLLTLGTFNNAAWAQDESATEEVAAGSDECKKEFQIFTDNAKIKDYQYALPAFRYLLNNCLTPGTGLYIRGEVMLQDLIKKETDESIKKGWIDTLFLLYERRFEAGRQDSKYGTEGFILGKKVKALALYDKNKVDEIYGWSKRVLELEKENTEAQVMYLHMIYTAFLRKANKKDCGDVIDAYNLINDLIESGLENITEADSIQWNNFQLAQNKVSDLAGPCLTCENLMEVLERDFASKSSDSLWIRNTSAALDRKSCAKKPEYVGNANLIGIMEKNAEFYPNATAYLRLGRMYTLAKEENKAVTAFKKAVDLEADPIKKAKFLMVQASAQREAGSLSGARQAARMAAEIQPNWGEPYIFIGDLYASSGGSCSTDNKCTSFGAYWAASDQYIKAKSIDPSVAEKAQKRLNNMAGSYPLKADCFFIEMKDGDSVSVGCWIQTTTTVRTR